jgi:L-amino acid N-acyltransferase YncA
MAASSITDRIRPATIDDAAGCAAVYRLAVLEGTGTFETDPPDAAEMARRIGLVLGRGWPWLVAEAPDGEIVGYAYCAQFRDRAAYAHSGETSVYVAADKQGRGLGRDLMERLLAASAEAGFRQFIAVIGDSANASSIGLHRALGFRHVGTLTDAGLKFGRLLDVVLMQRG